MGRPRQEEDDGKIRNAHSTYWENFKAKLSVLRRDKSDNVHSPMRIELSVNELENALNKAYEDSCAPIKFFNICH